jgi:hypothetical protein
MNEKIYLQDPYCREFEASVVDTTGVAVSLREPRFIRAAAVSQLTSG